MNSRDNENIKDLFAGFLDIEQAESHFEDVQKAEQILREHPAPEPDSVLIANIKAEIAARLSIKKTRTFSKTAYRIACAAATIMIISAITSGLFDRNKTPARMQYGSFIPAAIWESDNITNDDEKLAVYTVEIEQIEEELRLLQVGEGAGNRRINELGMELVAINNDFWKE
ncbi:MAG: hypothetical protein JW837_01170 [Sedimentisphaerales bacterium]|nr:hypothetical protein [Sedimentisphaerales bacterium]